MAFMRFGIKQAWQQSAAASIASAQNDETFFAKAP
jgi:hypothetical protein